MSLAYKLWKIGSVLDKEDIKNAVKDDMEIDYGEEPSNLNINFILENNEIKKIELNENGISKEKMFFSKKIGGSGGGMYYLYPNLNIINVKKGKEREELSKKISQLVNTINMSVLEFCNDDNKESVKMISNSLLNIKDHIEKVNLIIEQKNYEDELEKLSDNEDENKRKKLNKKIDDIFKKMKKMEEEYNEWNSDLIDVCEKIFQKEGNNFWFWISINGKTFYELMPEIWDNWYETPVIKNEDAKKGFDAFTNMETEIGYRPEIKVFSYDNYHYNLNYRINQNLPLSLESAKNIKFAWIYILENLVFYYKGLEYVIIPNLLLEDVNVYKDILNSFKEANKKTNSKKAILDKLRKTENTLENKLKKLVKKKLLDNEIELEVLRRKRDKIINQIKKIDKGIIEQFEEEVNELGENKNLITIDYLFTKINRTNLSFELKSSIEDIVPSQIRKVVDTMRAEPKISDLVTLKNKDKDKSYLHDFFNRNEIYFILNKSGKNNENSILKERLFLAKLLLTDFHIKISDLMKRFHFNREFDYKNKKRLTKEGVKEWIAFPDKFRRDEENIFNFLTNLGKIKE